MSQLEKLKNRLKSQPKDFSWAELQKILITLGYEESQVGKTSGSRVRFIKKDSAPIMLHKPHPKPYLKQYQIKQIVKALQQRGQL